MIDNQFERALEKDRKALICQNRRNKNKQREKVRVILPQNEGNPPIWKWLRDAKKTLIREEKSKEIGKNDPNNNKTTKKHQKQV